MPRALRSARRAVARRLMPSSAASGSMMEYERRMWLDLVGRVGW